MNAKTVKQCMVWLAAGAVLLVTFAQCGREHLPKPVGYNRLELPTHAYRTLPDTLPYVFEYSQHALLLPDTFATREKYWIQIYYTTG